MKILVVEDDRVAGAVIVAALRALGHEPLLVNDGREGWNGGRYGVYHDWEGWQRQMQGAGFVALTHYYRPAGLPRAEQPWLASVWRKPAA